MRALTLWQPWADLIVWGGKDVENRTWPVPSTLTQWYRCRCGQRERPVTNVTRLSRHYHGSQEWGLMRPDGPFPFTMAVHAGKRLDRDAVWELDRAGWVDSMEARRRIMDWAAYIGTKASLRGELAAYDRLGVVLGTVDVIGQHEDWRCVEPDREPAYHDDPSWQLEATCSRWASAEHGTWHWQLANPVPLDQPIPARGRQGLWVLPDDLADAVRAA